MPTTAYSVYELQLMDINRGRHLNAAGGKVMVFTAGGTRKVTLYDPDSPGASLAQPVTPTRGKIRFATLATVTSVDVYGMDAAGRFFVRKGVVPSDTEVFLDFDAIDQVLVQPFDLLDTAATTETDYGFDFPTNSLILPWAAVHVATNESAKTIDVGLKSGESGGDADGFLVAASVATAGLVRGALVGTDTLGALLKEDTNGSSVLVPATYKVGATAVSLTFTLSSGTTAAAGYIILPYQRPVA